MNEFSILIFFLSISFVLAPFMTNNFFLKNSQVYSRAHAVSLLVLLVGFVFEFKFLAFVWTLFCIFGFFLYIKQEGRLLFSVKGLATCIPFIFSLISSTWFTAGINDLKLLGYNPSWSFYAALHGSVLGWFFVGCLVHLSERSHLRRFYLFGSYLCLILFLSVAFGIDGAPYLKKIGVIGLSVFVPFSIGLFTFKLKKANWLSLFFAVISVGSIILSMTIAILNEFNSEFPKEFLGLPFMTLTHGLLNTIFTVPCFYLAIRLTDENYFYPRSSTDKKVVFFDGFCVLCSGTVIQLIKADKKRVLRYSSLQGEYANKVLEPAQVKSMSSVMFMKQGHLYQKAEAVIHILLTLDGIYKLLGMFLNIFPLFILNIFYDSIARNRYRFFGKNDTCLVPTSENRDLFIS